MNKTPLFLLFDIVLSLFIGCTNKQIDNELQQKNNPFDTDNKALLFNHIETVVECNNQSDLARVRFSDIRNDDFCIVDTLIPIAPHSITGQE